MPSRHDGTDIPATANRLVPSSSVLSQEMEHGTCQIFASPTTRAPGLDASGSCRGAGLTMVSPVPPSAGERRWHASCPQAVPRAASWMRPSGRCAEHCRARVAAPWGTACRPGAPTSNPGAELECRVDGRFGSSLRWTWDTDAAASFIVTKPWDGAKCVDRYALAAAMQLRFRASRPPELLQRIPRRRFLYERLAVDASRRPRRETIRF